MDYIAFSRKHVDNMEKELSYEDGPPAKRFAWSLSPRSTPKSVNHDGGDTWSFPPKRCSTPGAEEELSSSIPSTPKSSVSDTDSSTNSLFSRHSSPMESANGQDVDEWMFHLESTPHPSTVDCGGGESDDNDWSTPKICDQACCRNLKNSNQSYDFEPISSNSMFDSDQSNDDELWTPKYCNEACCRKELDNDKDLTPPRTPRFCTPDPDDDLCFYPDDQSISDDDSDDEKENISNNEMGSDGGDVENGCASGDDFEHEDEFYVPPDPWNARD